MPWLLVIQIVLLILWYCVPMMTTLSAWIILMPLIAFLVAAAIWGIVTITIFVAAVLWATKRG